MALFSDVDLDDTPPLGKFITNSLGYFYTILAGVWILLIIASTIWLYVNRKNGAIRLRNMPITVLTMWASTVIIVFNTLQYPMNGSIPCDVEFWIYSIIFPLSVVLLQAKNTQLYIMFAKNLDAYLRRRDKTPKLLPHKVKKYMIKGAIDVMIFHFAATSFIYIFSTRFNSRGVIKGSNEDNPDIACHDGWEWYPKHLGLLIYTYIIGPVLIYSLQKIEDTHKMKLEILVTILTSWACLPLFIFSYRHSSFNRINHAIPPLLWFNLSLVTICIICFAFPAYEMYKISSLRKEEVHKTRGIFIKILDANISQEFAKVLSDPIEFQKFAAFAVKDLSIENPLFFERAMKWRRNACITYNVDPSVSEKEFKKFTSATNTPNSDMASSSNFPLSQTSQSFASTAFSEPPNASKVRVCTNPDGSITHNYEKTLGAQHGEDTLENSRDLSTFAHIGSSQHFMNDSGRNLMLDSLEQTFNRMDRFNDARPPKANAVKTDNKLRDLDARRAISDECHKLVQEFIASDSSLSLNIVASTRRAILSSFDSERGYQIVFIFDKAIAEVVELMYTNSYLRYLSARQRRNNKFSLPLFKRGRFAGSGY